MKVKEKSEKAGLELSIQKMKIVASSPITSWQIDGENVETVSDFIFLGSKITADGYCSHKIKRLLVLGRIAVTNLDSVLKSRDITLPTKVRLVKAIVVQLWELDYKDSWVPNNWCFWTVVLERSLGGGVLWTARRPNQSILKEINPFEWFQHHFEAEAPILWPPDAKSWLTGKDSDAGKDWGQEEKGQQRMRWLDSNHQLIRHESEQTLEDSEGQGSLRAAAHGVAT